MGNNVPPAIANMNRNDLNELIADCTCPICQDLFEEPSRLTCNHTFCKKCLAQLRRQQPEHAGLSPLARMLLLRMDSDEQANCPICRGNIDYDTIEPNTKVSEHLKKLKEVKKYCCQEDSCWNPVQNACELCKQRLCEDHDEKRHDRLRKEAQKLRAELGAFTRSDTENEELSRLMLQRESISTVAAKLQEVVLQAMLQFDHQLSRSMREIQSHADHGRRIRQSRSNDLEQLEQWLSSGNLQQLQAKLQPMRDRLQQSQREAPTRATAQQLSLSELDEALTGVFSQLEPHTFVDAYTHVDSELKALTNLKTKHEVWDMQILTNTTGLTVQNKCVKLQHNAKQIKAPCLVVNFKGFPTKRLHLTDMQGAEFACIELEFSGDAMVGRFHICNQHQLLCCSDAGRNCINVCSLDGRLLQSIESEGSAVGALCEPLGLYIHSCLLYVTDSDNKRLVIFDVDEGYRVVGCVQHSQMSDNICDVIVSDHCIVVLDGNTNSLFVFDTSSRQFIRRQKLECSGFQLATDRHGNIFVSLPKEAKVQVFNPDCSSNIKTFSIADHLEMPGIRRLNGLALEAQSGRMFSADTFRELIHVLQI